MNATIEEQGMLKILEHLYSLLFVPKKITSRLITEKTGIESKYLRKLVVHGVVECGGSGKNTYYKWAAIRPNIYMAKEVLKDAADFTNAIDDSLVAALGLAEHPYFKYGDEDIRNNTTIKRLEPILPLEVVRKDRDNKVNICNDAGFSQRQIAEKLNTSVATVNRSIKKKNINVPFDEFWDIYDKKIDRDKCEKKWAKLSDTDRSQIMLKLPEYIASTPDKTFRRNPLKYLDTRSWEQELVKHVYFKDTSHVNTAKSLSDYSDSELWEELKRRGYTGTITKALE